jgi:hypothetical protein
MDPVIPVAAFLERTPEKEIEELIAKIRTKVQVPEEHAKFPGDVLLALFEDTDVITFMGVLLELPEVTG